MIPEFVAAHEDECADWPADLMALGLAQADVPERFRVRPALPDDLAEIYAIETAGFPAHDRWSQLAWAAELTGARIVLLADGGVITLQVVGEVADLMRMVVLPESRGRGLGRMLVAHGIAAVAARGAERLLLEVESDNEPALAVYRAMGFTEIDRRRDYYGAGRDALVMEFWLVEETDD